MSRRVPLPAAKTKLTWCSACNRRRPCRSPWSPCWGRSCWCCRHDPGRWSPRPSGSARNTCPGIDFFYPWKIKKVSSWQRLNGSTMHFKLNVELLLFEKVGKKVMLNKIIFPRFFLYLFGKSKYTVFLLEQCFSFDIICKHNVQPARTSRTTWT